MMHQQKSKRILIYFFLLFLFRSINNIQLNQLKFENIENIKVVGLGNENNKILLKNIKNLNLGNIFFINSNKIDNIITSNSLVEKYEVFKKYPSSLIINIDKTKFLANINDNGKVFLIGSNGKLSNKNYSNSKLPFIFGNPSIKDFLEFKKILDTSSFAYKKIKNLYYFSSKRWDLELKNNVIVKLPQNNVKDSLKLVSEFLVIKDIDDIKIVDVRIKNQIILNE